MIDLEASVRKERIVIKERIGTEARIEVGPRIGTEARAEIDERDVAREAEKGVSAMKVRETAAIMMDTMKTKKKAKIMKKWKEMVQEAAVQA